MLYRSVLVSDARGSAGGITSSRNRSGNYLRKRIKPTNVLTGDRTRARNDLAGAAADWTGLSDAERAAWNNFADTQSVSNKIGESIKLSGMNWYARINSLRSLGGLAAITTPPANSGSTLLTDVGTIQADDSANTVSFNCDGTNAWASQDDGRLFVFATQPVSAGRNSPTGNFRFIGSLEGDAGTPVDGTQSLAIPVGRQPVSGQAQFFRFIAIDEDGRLSVQQVKRTVAVP